MCYFYQKFYYMHEIKIYGDIVHVTEKTDNNISLLDVQNQLALSDGGDVTVRIASDGGDVNEGFAIYNELRRYAKTNNAKIKTFAESRLSSIATVIFLAGDERELSADLQPFVHKAYVNSDRELSDKENSYLTEVNTRIANHYVAHTDLTFTEALSLMEDETYITTEEAKAMRFATSIENVLRPVALERFNINKNEDKMNKKSQTLLNKAMQFLKGFQNKVVETAEGTELDFYELADDGVIEVGAKAYFDGVNAQGDYVMLTGEVYKFEAGELTEIVVDEVEPAVAELEAEIQALRDQLEAVTNKAVELEAQNKEKDTLIVNFKASSKAAPKTEKEAPKAKEEAKEATMASKAVANFNKFKTK